MILVIDNYGSFTYNLVQYIGEFSSDIKIIRNDELTISELSELNIHKIIISPGPGRPKDAGISLEVVKNFHREIPILGVCLGHQVIGEAFGGTITYSQEIMHGKVSKIYHSKAGVYDGVEHPFNATRYHSLVIEEETFPEVLEITARSSQEDNCSEIMGLKHKDYAVYGLQFHPESILTQYGHKLLENFLNV